MRREVIVVFPISFFPRHGRFPADMLGLRRRVFPLQRPMRGISRFSGDVIDDPKIPGRRHLISYREVNKKPPGDKKNRQKEYDKPAAQLRISFLSHTRLHIFDLNGNIGIVECRNNGIIRQKCFSTLFGYSNIPMFHHSIIPLKCPSPDPDYDHVRHAPDGQADIK